MDKTFILDGTYYDMRGCIISVGDVILGINTSCLDYDIAKVINLCGNKGRVVTEKGIYDCEDCLALPHDYIDKVEVLS